jgi:hypothetical protein
MRYLCAVYLEPKNMQALSPAEQATLDRDSLAYDQQLMKAGNFIAANALQPVTTARTLRVRNGKLRVTDGPFAETKEHLGGFILVDAKDEEEALDIASKVPMAKYGTIELRPIMNIG